MSFTIQMRVRFAHIDAAGIVFYPRYFEMLNAAVEEWFAARTGISFAEFHLGRRLGVPTLKIDTRFISPSRLGEMLTIAVIVERLGQSSCAVRYEITCEGEERVIASAVLVCMNLDTAKSTPWPDDIRAGLASTETIEAMAAA